MGFLRFHSGVFEQLMEIAIQAKRTEAEIKKTIMELTSYTNELLNLASTSEKYEIHIIDYDDFEGLYRSIHQDLLPSKIPTFLVAGAINLKDPDVPGYVPLSLPRSFVENQNHNYTLKELLANAAHERFERFLHKDTILSKVYKSARDDYHEKYTLNKEKNVTAFLLYALNKDLIPLQETITYAITYLVEHFLETNFKFLAEIQLPLVDRPFIEEERIATEKYIKIQLNRARIEKVDAEVALKRIKIGLNVLQTVTRRFQSLKEAFLEQYPKMKAEFKGKEYNFMQVIRKTINKVLQENGLTNLMLQFEQELANS